MHGPFETSDDVASATLRAAASVSATNYTRCKAEGCEELPTDSRGYCQKHVEDILQGNPNIGGTDPDGR